MSGYSEDDIRRAADIREWLVKQITDKQESLRGTMRLVGGMTVCLYVFPSLLAEVRRTHPHLDLEIIAFKAAGRNGPALFIGQWVPTFLILGLYNKLVKVGGSDRTERRKEEHASADFGFNVP